MDIRHQMKVQCATICPLGDSAPRTSMGIAARVRAVGKFDYSVLVARLAAVLHSAWSNFH